MLCRAYVEAVAARVFYAEWHIAYIMLALMLPRRCSMRALCAAAALYRAMATTREYARAERAAFCAQRERVCCHHATDGAAFRLRASP